MKKQTILLFILLGLSLMLAACGAQPQQAAAPTEAAAAPTEAPAAAANEEQAAASTKAAAAEEASAPVTLTYLVDDSQNSQDTVKALVEAYTALHPNVTINIESRPGGTEGDNIVKTRLAEVRRAFAARYLKGSQVPIASAPPSEVRQRMDRADAISRGNLKAVDYGPVTSQVFNADLFTPTQTAYVLALHFDLLPEKLRQLAVVELVADIERRDMHLSTGFVGAPYLPHVLSDNGRLDIAYALLHQKTWPSWLYSVTQGATTIWERWDGWTEENGFQDPGMNSFNHYAYGSIGAWLYSTAGGIELDPAQPGYKHIILRPQPGGGLTHATGKLKTLYGELVSQWKLDNGTFEWMVVVPPNTTATVYLPAENASKITLNGQAANGSVHEVGSGEYRFVVV